MAKKMILIDPSRMMLKNSPVPDALSESVLSVDDDIRRILDSTGISQHDKAIAYQQALHHYLTKVDQVNTRDSKPRVPFKEAANERGNTQEVVLDDKLRHLEKRVVESVPKTLQKKASLLLEHLKETSNLTWNERGEIALKGQTVEGSNVADLVNETLRARKLSDEPIGWKAFAQALTESNVPLELIGNKARWLTVSNTPPLTENKPELTSKKKKKNYIKKERQGVNKRKSNWLDY